MGKPAFLARALAAAALAAVLAAGAVALLSGPAPKPDPAPAVALPERAEAVPVTDPEGCRACHETVFAQWSRSRHVLAWTNPQLRAFADLSLGIGDCVRCHAPRPVFVTGPGQEPETRDGSPDSGVDCLTCHASAQGVVGARDNASAPCAPHGDARLSSSAACAGCHRTIGLDWKESPAAREGLQCQDCHMRADGRVTHDMRGGHDPSMLAKAFSLDLSVQDGTALVTVANRGNGHNFPGERHFRILKLFVEVLDPSGAVTNEFRTVIKDVSPIRKARLDAKIRAGAAETYAFPLPAGPGGVRALLLYKLYPSDLDAEGRVLAERRLRY